ncbi:MAG: hypothetical protein HYX71_06210 [Opitutae bacterium]|nr:hypothetical protein [Opitutae bacterium]
METTKYDPTLIQKFADKLYAQARSIVITCTVIGIIAGGFAGHFLGDYSTRKTYAIIGAVVIGLLGFAIGQARAFALRLQAQTALCQMKIEENTRREQKAVA